MSLQESTNQHESDYDFSKNADGSDRVLLDRSQALSNLSRVLKNVVPILQPPPNRTASEWADVSRVLPQGSAEPGPWRSNRVPWIIPITAAASDPKYRRITAMMGSQMSKTDGVCLNIAGHRLDDDPVPILYIGPTRSNVDSVIEPRVTQMFKSCSSLLSKLTVGRKAKKLVKKIAGVTFRLAWAGSATELASQPACIVIVDEVDRMETVGGEGDPVTLAEARMATYPDGTLVLDSTPTLGSVDTEVDEHGIERWKLADPEDIQSPIWQYWQEGTRHEWAVPCPQPLCGQYFIPRFKLLWWPENATPAQALRTALLVCPHCGEGASETSKPWMNERGRFIAPGQRVVDDEVVGDPPDSDMASFWVSGLMSPWVSFGESASRWLRAVNSGKQDRIQATLNTRFGELYRSKGDAPEWQAVKGCSGDHQRGTIPDFVQRVYTTVDVQKDRLVWCTRGWGHDYNSAGIDYGDLWGDTEKPEVWAELERLLDKKYDGRPLDMMAIDSGFRTTQVYAFCQQHPGRTCATKGKDNPSKLFAANDVEVDRQGKKVRLALKLWSFDLNYFKTWVHEKIGWPKDKPGVWLLPEDVTEDYCRSIVAEQKMLLPSGRTRWVRTSKENHLFDCEVLQVLLAHMLDVRHLRPKGEEDNSSMDIAEIAKRLNG